MRKFVWAFAMSSWTAVACSGGGDDPTPPVGGDCTCLALGVDFQNGVGIASTVALPSLEVARDVVAVSGDPVVRRLEGRLYVVNRFGHNNVTIVDPQTWAVIDQFSTGADTNPQDVAVRGDKAYVALFGAPAVQVWDLRDTSKPPATIDLSSFDPDGNPEAHSVAVVGDRLFVSMSLLDENFVPRGRGRVVVVDTSTDAIVDSLELRSANPFGFLQRRGDDLVVSTVADFGGKEGCLERILASAPTPAVADCLATSEAMGGYVNAIAGGPDDDLLLAVSPSYDKGKILRFMDPEMVALSDSAHVATDVGYCAATNQVLYRDGASGGLFVYDLDEGALVTTEPLDLGLPASPQNGIACF